MLIQDLHIRVINAATREQLRKLILNPARDYQPPAAPRTTKEDTATLTRVHSVL
jgi:hypothetical protein